MWKYLDRARALLRGAQSPPILAQGANPEPTSGIAAPAQWLLDALGGTATSSSIRVDWNTALTSVPILSCIRILSEDVAKLPVKLFKLRNDGGREMLRLHPVWKLLALKPNKWMTPFDFKAYMVSQYSLNGNAIAIIRRDQQFGRPVELIPIDTPRVALWVHEGELWYYVSFSNELHRAAFGTAGALFPASDVIHVKWPVTWHGLWGLSPILLAREAIGNALALDRYAGHLYANNADIGGVLKHPGRLNQQALDRLRKQWESRYSGVANRARTAILEEGMSFEKLSMTAEDAQFILNRKFTVLEACRLYRIPPYKVADLDRTISSNIEEQSRSYADDTLVPIIRNFEDEYTAKLLVAREPTYIDIEHDLTAFLRGRIEDRFKVYANAIEHGIWNANEIRIKEGDSPRDGGNTYYYSNNMQPEGQELPPSPEDQMAQEATALLRAIKERRERRPNGYAA